MLSLCMFLVYLFEGFKSVFFATIYNNMYLFYAWFWCGKHTLLCYIKYVYYVYFKLNFKCNYRVHKFNTDCHT